MLTFNQILMALIFKVFLLIKKAIGINIFFDSIV